jgi:hypothetical protein
MQSLIAMKKNIYLFMSLMLGMAQVNPAQADQFEDKRADFKVILRAVDETGNPISAADLGFSWGQIGLPKPDTGSYREMSDEHGEAIFFGHTFQPDYYYGARKAGYYQAGGRARSSQQKEGRWQPWAQTFTITLKTIKNPVPMYTKSVIDFLPILGKPVGYDLEKGDWVSPYGKGEHADFEFLIEGKVESALNYGGMLTLRLPGKGNGILAQDIDSNSALEMPYEAPPDGYASSWTWQNACITGNERNAISKFVDDSNPQRGFIFRVRAVVDAQGHVIHAYYGTIPGPVTISPRLNGQWAINFTYYYNPDETRNLEFDPQKLSLAGKQ